MEDVIQTYLLPYDPEYPVVCFDEACKQLFAEVRSIESMWFWLAAEWEFRRGFVERIILSSDEFLASASLLARIAPIRELQLRGGCPHQPDLMKTLLTRPLVRNLTRLDLPYYRLAEADVQMLVKSEQLGRLKVLTLPHEAPRGMHGLGDTARRMLQGRFGSLVAFPNQ
jgi:hypothetical protein